MEPLERTVQAIFAAHRVADFLVNRAYGPDDAEMEARRTAVHAKIESLIYDLKELDAMRELREARERGAAERPEPFEPPRDSPPARYEHRQRAEVVAQDPQAEPREM